MAERVQVKPVKPGHSANEIAERDAVAQAHTEQERQVGEAALRGEKLKTELDELLDEIDGVLEDNAEEFVRNYVQKGGE